MGKVGFICKSKGGIGSGGSDQEITDLLEEGSIKWREDTTVRVKTAAACGRKTKQWQPV